MALDGRPSSCRAPSIADVANIYIAHDFLLKYCLIMPRWLDDTWLFDGSAWHDLTPPPPTSPTRPTSSSAPSPRYGHTLNTLSSSTSSSPNADSRLAGVTGAACVLEGVADEIATAACAGEAAAQACNPAPRAARGSRVSGVCGGLTWSGDDDA